MRELSLARKGGVLKRLGKGAVVSFVEVMVVERCEGRGGGCDTRGGCVCATIGGS